MNSGQDYSAVVSRSFEANRSGVLPNEFFMRTFDETDYGIQIESHLRKFFLTTTWKFVNQERN